MPNDKQNFLDRIDRANMLDSLELGEYGSSAQSRPPSAGGPTVPANIQLYGRPEVPVGGKDMSNYNSSRQGEPGSYGTVYSESRPQGNMEVLYPRIYNGQMHPSDVAWQHYLMTGQHMGKFANPEAADQFGEQYHLDAANGVYDRPKRFVHASKR
jgi:hypothetical protein